MFGTILISTSDSGNTFFPSVFLFWFSAHSFCSWKNNRKHFSSVLESTGMKTTFLLLAMSGSMEISLVSVFCHKRRRRYAALRSHFCLANLNSIQCSKINGIMNSRRSNDCAVMRYRFIFFSSLSFCRSAKQQNARLHHSLALSSCWKQ